jgi:hypothetical protein
MLDMMEKMTLMTVMMKQCLRLVEVEGNIGYLGAVNNFSFILEHSRGTQKVMQHSFRFLPKETQLLLSV